MAWIGQNVKAMPKEWGIAITFKEPSDNDKLGWIDPVDFGGSSKRSMATFRFLGATDAPLACKPVRTPYDCFTMADVLGKGRSKLTMRIQINEEIWKSLDNLDSVFRQFLIRNRTKLFSKQDAEYISRDNNAVALKFKPLALRGPDGSPLYDSFITLRINGRAGEISDIETKDGPTGKYVSDVTWAPRMTPLAATATRFAICTGKTADGLPIVSDLLPNTPPIPVGGQRMRYVGPGDIATEKQGGCCVRYLLVRPAYWALAPGGSASISLVIDSLILQNGVASEAPSGVMPPLQAPAGFALASESEGPVHMPRNITGGGVGSAGGGIDWGFSNANGRESAAASSLVPGDQKRQRTSDKGDRESFVKSLIDSEMERKIKLRPQLRPPSEVLEARRSVFSTSSSASASAAGAGPSPHDVEEYLESIAEEHEAMKRASAILPDDDEDETE